MVQSDEVLVFSSLCKSNVVPDLSRSLRLLIMNKIIGQMV